MLDPDFEEKVVKFPHPKCDKQLGEIQLTYKIACAHCEQPWGIQMIYKGSQWNVLAIDNFVIEEPLPGDDRVRVKKWKNAPFVVQELDTAALETQLS